MEENITVCDPGRKESKFSPYQVKLSCIFMGLGQIFCRQYIKGVLLMILEGLFIFFLAVAGVSNIIPLSRTSTISVSFISCVRKKRWFRDTLMRTAPICSLTGCID